MSFLINPYIFAPAATGGDPDFSSVVLLMPFDGTNGATTFTDLSSQSQTSTALNQAQLSSLQSKFGATSLLCDGTNDGVYITSNPTDFTFGTGAFTVEFHVYFNALGATQRYLFDQRNGSTSNALACIYQSSGDISFSVSGSQITGGNASMVTGTWYHVAMTRDGSSNARIFIDGVQIGSTATLTNNLVVGSASQPLKIALNGFNNSSNFDGYMANWRVTKGVARYTSNFAPPTALYPTE